jgi:hypothetical protein
LILGQCRAVTWQGWGLSLSLWGWNGQGECVMVGGLEVWEYIPQGPRAMESAPRYGVQGVKGVGGPKKSNQVGAWDRI